MLTGTHAAAVRPRGALFHRTFETRSGRDGPGAGIECRIGQPQRRHSRGYMALDIFDAWWSGLMQPAERYLEGNTAS
ncbi:hypothetical protein OKW46_000436 [Paraburkholderia sp. WSM4179]|nr:hypothetical protein [Paraburkholderia sp. WSM4179]